MVSFVLLLLFAGLRYKVGYDYDNYEKVATYVANNLPIFVEPVFWLLIKAIQIFTTNYQVFVFSIALVSLSIKFSFLSKYSYIPLLSVLVYYSRIYLNGDFGQLRQGLALGIVLFTYPALLNRKIVHFSLLMLLASMIHASAILFYPIYFVAHKYYSRKFIIGSIFIAMIIAFIDIKVVLSQTLAVFLPPGLALKLLFYTATEEELGITFSVILRLIIILLCLTVFWQKIKADYNFNAVFNVYFFGYLFYLVFNSLPQLGGRGSMYFQQFELLLFPLMLCLLRDNILKILFFLFLAFYSFWGVRTLLESATDETSYYFEPYESVL